MLFHLIVCLGCARAWVEVRNWSGCSCICVPGDPQYEAWVTDPDPALIPARCRAAVRQAFLSLLAAPN